MRKAGKSCLSLSLAVALLTALSAAIAQDASPANSAALPSDPKALMLLASQLNNLTAAEIEPWHLKATYQLLDDKGNATDEGTYEEFWASRTENKVIYTGSATHCTDFQTKQGLLRAGTLPASDLIISAVQEFVEPLPDPQVVDHQTFEIQRLKAGSVQLVCAKLTGLPANPGLSYCMADDFPALRVNGIGYRSLEVLHNRIEKFQGHFIAGDLQFQRGGKTVLTAHLEKIEHFDPVHEDDFAPSADAKLVPRKVNISAGVAQGMLVKKVSPQYPVDAKLSGTVVLQALIGKDGHIADLKVVSGAPELRRAALDAVQTWVYRPYLLNGEPVEVNTSINVVFALSR
jgi:TonB family protein